MSEHLTAEVLKAAKARIEDPKHWCRGAFAKNALGAKVYARDKSACRWCAVGALGAQLGGSVGFTGARSLLEKASGCDNIVSVNDGKGDCHGISRYQSHKRVLAAYDKAIEMAGGRA